MTAVDPDAHLHRRKTGFCLVVVHLVAGPLHGDGAGDRVVGVVRITFWGSKDRKQAVSQEVNHVALMPGDDFDHGAEVVVQKLDQLFGMGLFGEAGEVAQIGKEEGHLPPVPAEHGILALDHHFPDDLFRGKAGEGSETGLHAIDRPP